MQDEFYMARALKLAQRGRSPLTLTLMSAVSLLTMATSSAKVITIAPESRTPRFMRCGWRAQKPKAQPPMSRLNPVAIMGERRHVAMR